VGLREDIQKDLGIAFDTDLSDAVKTLFLIKLSTGDYSEDTGINTPVESTYSTRGVLDGYEDRELFDSAVHPTDVKAIILTNELSATPEIDDYIECSGIRYKAINVMADPADAHWEIQCRR